MSEIINLRSVRKAKQRAEAVAQAASNRAVFGRSKAEKLAARNEMARNDATLDGAKRNK